MNLLNKITVNITSFKVKSRKKVIQMKKLKFKRIQLRLMKRVRELNHLKSQFRIQFKIQIHLNKRENENDNRLPELSL